MSKLRFKASKRVTRSTTGKVSVPDANTLDEEDFAEFLRRGHAKIKQTAQQREEEELEQARLAEEEALRKRQAQIKAEWQRAQAKKRTEEGLKREMEQVKQRDSVKRKRTAGYLDLYHDEWQELQATLKSPSPIVTEVPWPTHERFPQPNLTKDSIREYLQLDTLTNKERKKVIQQELLRYHPDKFSRVANAMHEGQHALELAKQTTQILNNLSE